MRCPTGKRYPIDGHARMIARLCARYPPRLPDVHVRSVQRDKAEGALNELKGGIERTNIACAPRLLDFVRVSSRDVYDSPAWGCCIVREDRQTKSNRLPRMA